LSRLSDGHRRFADLPNAFSRTEDCPAAQPDCNQCFGSRVRLIRCDPLDASVGCCGRETDNLIFHLPPPIQGEDTGEGKEVANGAIGMRAFGVCRSAFNGWADHRTPNAKRRNAEP